MSEKTRPIIVCLCGSTRFSQAFRDANLRETLAGKIVLSVGCDMRSDDDIFAGMSEEEKDATKGRLDELHLRKIDLADEVLILNVGQYVGESTKREYAYAEAAGKPIRFLEKPESAHWLPCSRCGGPVFYVRDIDFPHFFCPWCRWRWDVDYHHAPLITETPRVARADEVGR